MTRHDAAAPWTKDLLILALLFGALNLLLLGGRPLANPDEARYAEIPREMLAHGDWVTPRLNDIPYFEKPPLVYWTVAIARVAFGPGEFSMRLTPALFGWAGVLLTYATARRLHGRAAGMASAVVLGTSGLYFVLSRILLLDMAVSVLMSACLFCFILAVQTSPGPRRRWFFYGLYASAALATLAKGLIGFLIPGAIMFFWLLVCVQWRRLLPMYLPSGIALFTAIAAPWHVLAAQRNPGWAEFYFVHEHWQRFTSTVHDRAQPFWFFIPVLVIGLFPWIGFLGGAARDALAGGWARRKENAVAWFWIIWPLFVLLFFSKSQSKLIPYILPAFPALAVLIGTWLSRQWEAGAHRRLRIGMGVFVFICGLLSVAAIAVVSKPGIVHDAEQAASLRPYAFALAVTLLLGGITAHWAARVKGVFAGVATMVATIAGFVVVLSLAAPRIERPETKTLALIAREKLKPADRVYHYWAFFQDFVYYAEHPVGLVNYTDELEKQFLSPAERAAQFIDDAELRRQWAGPGRVWLVVRKHDRQQPASVFADASFQYHLIAETPTHSLLSNQP